MKSSSLAEFFYLYLFRAYKLFRVFIELVVFISPLHRVRDEEGRFRGVVIMLPCIVNRKFGMYPKWRIGNFK